MAQPSAMKEVYGPEQDTVNGHVIIRGSDSWHLFYGSKAGSLSTDKRHATSDDLLTWTTQEPVLRIGGPGDCDGGEIGDACVIEHQGRWYMAYQARPTLSASRRFALAVSDDLWTGAQRWYTAFEVAVDLADPIGDHWACYASPQVYEDLLIVLVQRRGLLALSREDGGTVWERQLGVEYHYAAPALAGDLLITGGDNGKLAVLNARSGEMAWHLPVLEAGYPSGLTVEDGRIYVTTPEGQVRCCDLHTGELRWEFQCGDDLLDMIPYRREIRSILARPIVYRVLVIICGCDGGMYMLDALSGECKSRMRFDAPVTAPPCLVEGGFCVGTRDGRLYRFAG